MTTYEITTIYLWNHRGRLPAHAVSCNGKLVKVFGQISKARAFVKEQSR